MVGAAGFLSGGVTIGDEAQVAYELELVLARVDLAAEQRRPRSMAPRVLQEEEGIERRPSGPSKDAGNQVRVIRHELLHRSRPVVGHLQEERPTGPRYARQSAGDEVVDVAPAVTRRGRRHVRVEDLEEMTEARELGL